MASRRAGCVTFQVLGWRHVSLSSAGPELRCAGAGTGRVTVTGCACDSQALPSLRKDSLCRFPSATPPLNRPEPPTASSMPPSPSASDESTFSQLPRHHRRHPTTPAALATPEAQSWSHRPLLPTSPSAIPIQQRHLLTNASATAGSTAHDSSFLHFQGTPSVHAPAHALFSFRPHQSSHFHSLATPCLRAPVQELKLAQTGEGIAECELLQWFVREGDEVKPFQLVCQVQSDKATVDITSRFAGRVVRTHFVPGDVIKVGETLADILEESLSATADAATASSASPDEEGTEDKGEEGAVRHGDTGSRDGDRASGKRGVLATPAVRHLARGYGVSLADVAGTGAGGRVLKEDVVRFVALRQAVEEEVRMEGESLEGPDPEIEASELPVSDGAVHSTGGDAHTQGRTQGPESSSLWPTEGEPVAAGPGPSHPKDTEILIRGYRRAMVKAMAAAAAIPHFNFMDEFDVTTLADLVSGFNTPASSSPSPSSKSQGGNSASDAGLKLTHLPFLVKALSLALLHFPTLNATVDPDVTTIRCSGSHNIGIAMATPHGLVVPSVKSCESRSVAEIASEIRRLRQLASANQLSQADLVGGTITISNIGAVGGGTYACPLVFQPQLAIVALGRVRRLPRFDEQGEVCAASIMNVSWAADHRVVDGALLAGLSMEWQRLVENPERLLLALR